MNQELKDELAKLNIEVVYDAENKRHDLLIRNNKIFKETLEGMRPKWVEYLKSKGAEFVPNEVGATKFGNVIGGWVIRQENMRD